MPTPRRARPPAAGLRYCARMNRALLFAVPFVVTLGLALLLLGVFDPPPEAGPSEPSPAASRTDVSRPPDEVLRQVEPGDEPEPEIPLIEQPVRVLALANAPRSFTGWCFQLWESSPRIQWQVWYAKGAPDGVPRASDGLPALAGPPTTADVDEAQVLFLGAFDVAQLPASFWEHVALRVRERRLGLLVVPDHLSGHPTASEPSLRTVLPVASVLPLAPRAPGDRVLPGVFQTAAPFAATEAGTRHPASRIVPFDGWSRKIWSRLAQGKHGWSTKFVSPVEALAPGAAALVEVIGGDARWPALVVSGGAEGRAVWAGGLLDIDWSVYRDDYGTERMRAIVTSWVAWLAAAAS